MSKGMYKPKLERDITCPLEYGLDIFGGKWKARILCVLGAKGVIRYNALRKELANITDAVLAAALKELMSDGVIQRIQYNEIPPRVEYQLTEKGRSALPILQDICQWSGAYRHPKEADLLAHCQMCDYSGPQVD